MTQPKLVSKFERFFTGKIDNNTFTPENKLFSKIKKYLPDLVLRSTCSAVLMKIL